MSFAKCLMCDTCKKHFNICEALFPEDLYDLIKKYENDQLFWLCQICKSEKDKAPCSMNALMGEVKNNTEEMKKINDTLMIMNDSICNIVTKKDLRMVEDKIINRNYTIDSSRLCDSGISLTMPIATPGTNFLGSRSPAHDDSLKTLPLGDKNSPANNTAHKILQQILRDIKPAEDEAKESKKIVENFMNTLIEKLKEDKEFNCLYSQPYYTGSSYNDLRISSATEYDIDIILKAPPGISLKVQFFGQACAFAKIKWEKLKEFADSEQYILSWFEKRSEKSSSGQYLHPVRINSWFQSKLVKCLNNFPLCELIKDVKLSQSGPANTVKITCASGKCIDLDLVPVFKFDYSVFSASNMPKILSEFEVAPDKEMCVFVPKPLKAGRKLSLLPNVDSVWRLDLPEVEKVVLSRKPCAKCVIKLLKLLRDNMDWKGIASYYLKTLIMKKIQDNPSEDYWKQIYLYERFMEAMLELSKCLEHKMIPCLFSRDYNLIYQLNTDQCKNWSNKVKSFIESITSDINSLSKILKVK